MGWTLNGVAFLHNGVQTTVHTDGNNLSWICPECGHPVLFVYQNGIIGSSPGNPTTCLGCNATYSLDPHYGAQQEPPRGQIVIPAPIMNIV